MPEAAGADTAVDGGEALARFALRRFPTHASISTRGVRRCCSRWRSAAPARADGFLTPFYGFNFGGDQGEGCPSSDRLPGPPFRLGRLYGHDERGGLRRGPRLFEELFRRDTEHRQRRADADEQPAGRVPDPGRCGRMGCSASD